MPLRGLSNELESELKSLNSRIFWNPSVSPSPSTWTPLSVSWWGWGGAWLDRNGCFQATAQEGLVSICFRRKARYLNLSLQKLPKILVSSRYTVTTLRSAHLLGLHGCQVTQNTELESAPLPPCPVFMTFKHSFVFISGIAGPYSNSISFLFFLSSLKKNTIIYIEVVIFFSHQRCPGHPISMYST